MAQRWKKAGSLTTGGMSLNVFTQDEMDAIHRATLEVLEHTGVLIGSPEARALLVEAGASVIDEDIVRFPQWMVADAVSCAPETLLLAGRTPDRDVVLDSTRVMFTNFGEAVYLIDPDTGEVRNKKTSRSSPVLWTPSTSSRFANVWQGRRTTPSRWLNCITTKPC